MMKKKLNFTQKTLESHSKKKPTIKQVETPITRSFKKPTLTHT
jgi:hypothetical protein